MKLCTKKNLFTLSENDNLSTKAQCSNFKHKFDTLDTLDALRLILISEKKKNPTTFSTLKMHLFQAVDLVKESFNINTKLKERNTKLKERNTKLKERNTKLKERIKRLDLISHGARAVSECLEKKNKTIENLETQLKNKGSKILNLQTELKNKSSEISNFQKKQKMLQQALIIMLFFGVATAIYVYKNRPASIEPSRVEQIIPPKIPEPIKIKPNKVKKR